MNNRKIWADGDKIDLRESLEKVTLENQELKAVVYELEKRIEKLEAQQPSELSKMRMRSRAK